MGNYRWISEQVSRLESDLGNRIPLNWVELGAGDGPLANFFAPESCSTSAITGIDLAPRPRQWPDRWPWLQGDLFDALANHTGRWNAAIANLFLHHFDDRQLLQIGSHLAQFDVLLFCEPARRQLHRLQGFLAFPFVNRVTRHDMIVSVEAGFRGTELAQSLGLDPSMWTISVRTRFLGAYQFLAIRNSAQES